ncbi:hypothetical protein BJY04DRAFT_201365 [Aspergillus karnatakaensis]|uniref:uncharacterized protein n=1 Tax=Aspergillus karnatakaensis TaxID=1810916 RepID=UPI003CCD695F
MVIAEARLLRYPSQISTTRIGRSTLCPSVSLYHIILSCFVLPATVYARPNQIMENQMKRKHLSSLQFNSSRN